MTGCGFSPNKYLLLHTEFQKKIKLETETDPNANLDSLPEQTERDAWRTILIHRIARVEDENVDLKNLLQRTRKMLEIACAVGQFTGDSSKCKTCPVARRNWAFFFCGNCPCAQIWHSCGNDDCKSPLPKYDNKCGKCEIPMIETGELNFEVLRK